MGDSSSVEEAHMFAALRGSSRLHARSHMPAAICIKDRHNVHGHGRASRKAWVPCIGLAGRGTASDACFVETLGLVVATMSF